MRERRTRRREEEGVRVTVVEDDGKEYLFFGPVRIVIARRKKTILIC